MGFHFNWDYVTVLKKNIYAHNIKYRRKLVAKILFEVNYSAHLVLDGLDDLVVWGEDDGDGDDEAEGVDVGHVGEVVHRVHARPAPLHTAAEDRKCLGWQFIRTPEWEINRYASLKCIALNVCLKCILMFPPPLLQSIFTSSVNSINSITCEAAPDSTQLRGDS